MSVKTYKLKFRATHVSGKTIKIHGIISGMCQQHAIEEGNKIANDLIKDEESYVKVKLIKMKKLNCDFMVVPDKREASELSVEGFIDNLKNKYQIREEVKETADIQDTPFFNFIKKIVEMKNMKEQEKQEYKPEPPTCDTTSVN